MIKIGSWCMDTWVSSIYAARYILKVQFHEGAAVIVDWQENSGRTSDTVIESCLQMRWPGIQISWKDEKVPTLN